MEKFQPVLRAGIALAITLALFVVLLLWNPSKLVLWLKAFHVRFWNDLIPYLGTLETKGLVRLTVTPIYKRYAFIARLEKV